MGGVCVCGWNERKIKEKKGQTEKRKRTETGTEKR